MTVAIRLFDNVGENPTSGCWHYLGNLNAGGYGRVYIGSGKQLAHRVAYEVFIGPVPEGMELDHLCRVHDCVNPDHLEPVTHAENCRRGIAGEITRERMLARTHCARGHAWTPDNTKQTHRQRKCRACIREDSARARQRRKEKTP